MAIGRATCGGGAEDDLRDVAAARAGDGAAYRRLVERHQHAIAQQMARFSRDGLVRDELVHEVFVEAYGSLHGFRGDAPILHWLRKIAVRVGYRHWKRQKARAHEVALSPGQWEAVAAGAVHDACEAAELAHRLLAELPPADRLILTLIYLDGCTMAEAADRAGCTVTGAKVRAFRARNRLRKIMEGHSDEAR